MQTDQPVSPYMLQRWLSMYSPQVAVLVNATTNRAWSSLTSDTQAFVNLFETVIPRLRFTRISYIKKPVVEQKVSSNDEVVEIIAELFQISQREARDYITQDPSIAAKFIDNLEVFRKTRLKQPTKTD